MTREKIYTKEFGDNLADELIEWLDVPSNFWIGSFCAEKGFSRQRIPDIIKSSEKFATAYELAKQIQENKLYLGALTNKLNSFMAFSGLKNVSGWRDGKDLQVTGSSNVILNIITNADGETVDEPKDDPSVEETDAGS